MGAYSEYRKRKYGEAVDNSSTASTSTQSDSTGVHRKTGAYSRYKAAQERNRTAQDTVSGSYVSRARRTAGQIGKDSAIMQNSAAMGTSGYHTAAQTEKWRRNIENQADNIERQATRMRDSVGSNSAYAQYAQDVLDNLSTYRGGIAQTADAMNEYYGQFDNERAYQNHSFENRMQMENAGRTYNDVMQDLNHKIQEAKGSGSGQAYRDAMKREADWMEQNATSYIQTAADAQAEITRRNTRMQSTEINDRIRELEERVSRYETEADIPRDEIEQYKADYDELGRLYQQLEQDSDVIDTMQDQKEILEKQEYYNSFRNEEDFAQYADQSEEMSKAMFRMNSASISADSPNRYVTEEEAELYNYVYETQGKEAADDYLSTLNLTQRKTADQAEWWQEFAHEHPVLGSGASLLMTPFKGIGYVGNAINYLTGEEIDPYGSNNWASNMSSAIRNQVSYDVQQRWGGVGSFLYNTGMSMGDFLLSSGVVGGNQKLALTIMGTGAAADATISAKERGLSDAQAFLTGSVAGIAEAVTEKVSLDNLFHSDLDGVKYILKNALVEGGEEVEADVINLFADVIINGNQSEIEQAIARYQSYGKSYAEAFGLAMADQAQQMGLDFLGGALSGGTMATVGAGVKAYNNYSNGRAVNSSAPEVREVFIQNGLNSNNESIRALAEKAQNGEISNREMSKLVRAVSESVDVRTIVKNRLSEMGELDDAAIEKAEIILKAASGGRLTRNEQRQVMEDPNTARVYQEVFTGDMLSETAQQRDAVEGALAMARGYAVTASSSNTDVAQENAAKVVNAPSESGTDIEHRVAAGGQTTVKETSEPVSISAVTGTKGGKITVRLSNGEELAAEQLDLSDDDARILSRAKEYSANTASVLLNYAHTSAVMRTDMSIPILVNTFYKFYTYGQAYSGNAKMFDGLVTEMLQIDEADAVYIDIARMAYECGANDKNASVKEKQEHIEAEKGKKRGKGKAKVQSIDSDTAKEQGVSEVVMQTLTGKQKAAVDALKALAEHGLKIRLFESDGNVTGKGAQGWYDPADRTVYLDINAGYGTEQAILRTAGHELTHFIQDMAPEKYEYYKQFILEKFGEHKVEQMLLREQMNAEKAGMKLSKEQAMDEVISNASEMMLKDSKAVEELAKKDAGLFERVYEFVKNWAKNVIEAFQGIGESTEASRYAKEVIKDWTEIQKIWDDALEEALQANAVMSEGNADGLVQFKLRGVDENGIEVYETSEAAKEMSIKEKQYLLAKLIRREYSGRTAKFWKDGEVYYAYLSRDSVSKGVYGDKKSSEKGFETKLNIGIDGNYIELVENSLYSGSSEEQGKNRGIHKGTSSWDYYVKTIQSDGDYYDVLINVAKKKNGEFVYDVTVRENKKRISPSAAYKNVPTLQGRKSSSNNSIRDSAENSNDNQKKFSVRDSAGRELSEGQQEYFADSKVRDENGNLLVMYHGTPYGGFTVFDRELNYFTPARDYADRYHDPSASSVRGKYDPATQKQTYEVYLNIKRPFDIKNPEDKRIFIDEYVKGGNAAGINPYISKAEIEKQIENGIDWTEADNLKEFIEENEYDYDGLLLNEGADGGYGDSVIQRGMSYVTFQPEQVKNVDNVNPTEIEDIRYSTRAEDAMSIRMVLSETLLEVAQNDDERNKLSDYQKSLERVGKYYDELQEVRTQIRNEMLERGRRDTEKLNNLIARADMLANKVNWYDKQLLSLEATKPLRDIVTRERKLTEKKVKANARQQLSEYRERRNATELRRKIGSIISDISTRLLRPTDKKYVPDYLTSAMVEVCSIIDLDSGVRTETGELTKVGEKLAKLHLQYQELKDDEDTNYSSEYDENMADKIAELARATENMKVADMSYRQLQDVYDIMRDLKYMLIDATKQIGEAEARDNYALGTSLINEMYNVRDHKLNKLNLITGFTAEMELNTMRQVDMLSGYDKNAVLNRLFQQMNDGYEKKMKFVMNANKMFEPLRTGANRKHFQDAITKLQDYGITDAADGHKVLMTKMQAMQLVLTAERESASDGKHLRKGGFKIPDNKYVQKNNLEKAISNQSHVQTLTPETLQKIKESLTDYDKQFLETARQYFREVSTQAINETTLVTKHRKVARAKNYIPYKVDSDYVVSKENEAVQKKRAATIEGRGLLKETTRNAPQPLVIMGLNQLISENIEDVGTIYGLAIPIRNFNKVWNITLNGMKDSVKNSVKKVWGNKWIDIINQAVDDLQGGREQPRDIFSRALKAIQSAYVTKVLSGNISVVIKQISSYPTAGVYLSQTSLLKGLGRTFVSTGRKENENRYKKVIEEIDKYTAQHYLRRQGMSMIELGAYRDSVFGRMEAKLPDKVAKVADAINPVDWIQKVDCWAAAWMWTASKAQIESEGKYKKGTDEYWNAVTDLYDKVIEDSQSVSDPLHKTEFQKTSNVLTHQLVMFKSQPLQSFGIMYDAVNKMKAAKRMGRGDDFKLAKKQLYRAIVSQAESIILFAIMTYVAGMVLHRMNQFRDDDDELTKESVADRFFYNVLQNTADTYMPLIGGEAFELLWSKVNDERGYDYSIPVIDTINSYRNLLGGTFENGVNLIDHALAGDTDGMREDAKALLGNTVDIVVESSGFTGVPLANGRKIAEAVQLHLEDIQNGEFLSFEAGVERSNTTQYNRMYEALTSDDSTKYELVYEETSESMQTNGKTEEEAIKAIRTGVTSRIKVAFVEGEVTEEQAEAYLRQIGYTEDDAHWKVQNWITGRQTNYATFYEAIQNNSGLDEAIDELREYGYTDEKIAGTITGEFKEQYVALYYSNKSMAAELKASILNAYVRLGYDREKKSEDIDAWLEQD